MDWNVLLQNSLEAVLAVALPIVVGYLVSWLKAQKREVMARLDHRYQAMVEDAIQMAVRAAQQIYTVEEGEKKKEFAIAAAENYLRQWGLELDLNVMADMIEAEVLRQFKNGGVKALPAE